MTEGDECSRCKRLLLFLFAHKYTCFWAHMLLGGLKRYLFNTHDFIVLSCNLNTLLPVVQIPGRRSLEL